MKKVTFRLDGGRIRTENLDIAAIKQMIQPKKQEEVLESPSVTPAPTESPSPVATRVKRKVISMFTEIERQTSKV